MWNEKMIRYNLINFQQSALLTWRQRTQAAVPQTQQNGQELATFRGS